MPHVSNIPYPCSLCSSSLLISGRAQGVTVVAAVAGTYFLTNKPQQVRDRRQQVLTNQLPPDPDSIVDTSPASNLIKPKTTSSSKLATTSLQTQSQSQEVSSSGAPEHNRFDRGPRISQAMQQTEKALEGGEGAVKPRRVSEFGKRLEEAERLQRESEK